MKDNLEDQLWSKLETARSWALKAVAATYPLLALFVSWKFGSRPGSFHRPFRVSTL